MTREGYVDFIVRTLEPSIDGDERTTIVFASIQAEGDVLNEVVVTYDDSLIKGHSCRPESGASGNYRACERQWKLN
jgi:hypothetical protein